MPRWDPFALYSSRLRSADRRRLLRPLKTVEILETAVRAYQTNAGSLLSASIGPMLLSYVAFVFLRTFVLPAFTTTGRGLSQEAQYVELAVATLAAFGVGLPLLVLGVGLATARNVPLVSAFVMGERTVEDGREARTSWSVIGALLIVTGKMVLWVSPSLLLGLWAVVESRRANSSDAAIAVTFAVLSLVFFGLAAVSSLSACGLAPVVASLEEASARTAVRRSKHLCRLVPFHGSVGPTLFAALLLVVFLGVILNLALQFPLQLFAIDGIVRNMGGPTGLGTLLAGALTAVPDFAAVWLVMPIFQAAVTVAYFDRAVRLEALDIRVLTEDVRRADRRTVLLR
jgi:hypothetical protein